MDSPVDQNTTGLFPSDNRLDSNSSLGGIGVNETIDWTKNISVEIDNITTCVWNYTLNLSVCVNDTNSTGGVGGRPLAHPLWLTVILGLLAGAISIVTILGNITVLLSFGIERSIRQPTNYFLASLAVSDLLIGTFSMPLFTQYLLLNYWPIGPWLCDLWLSLDWTVCLTSQYTVFLITMDRFLSVKIPAKYRNWRTERKVLVMIALTWIFPTVVFFTAIIGWQYFVPEGRTVKEENCEVQFMSDPLFTFMLTIGYYWITLVVMCFLYGGIYKVALNLQRKSDAKQKKLQSTMELAADHSALRGTVSNSSDSATAASKKASKLPHENNTAAAQKNVTTTSFSKRNNSEKDEDRSSSPAFASDEENSSSQGAGGQSGKTPLTVSAKVPKVKVTSDKGFVNNALQPDSGRVNRRSLPMENSYNVESDEKNLLQPQVSRKDIQSDLISDYEPSTQILEIDYNYYPSEADQLERSSVPLLQNDVLKGIRFIDEKSFNSLNSDNIKLLSDSQTSEPDTQGNESKTSPVWRRRISISDNPTDTCEADPFDVRVPLATEDPFVCDNRMEVPGLPAGAKPTDGNNLSPYDHRDASGDRGMQRLSAARRRRKDGGRFQTFVKSVRSRNSRRRNRRERKSKSENRARKALRTITLILGAFVLCWTPYHIMVFVIAIAGYDSINMRFYNFTYWLCYLNSPINPFCYAFANVQFKRTFLRIFKLDWHRT